jgi:hypothetical protein
MWGSLNIVFNFKQNTLSHIAKNGVRPTTYFKTIRLARVRFEFETPALEDIFSDNADENIAFKRWISTDRCELVISVKSMKS